MDDKEQRHFEAAFLWLSRRHNGFGGGNSTSARRVLLSIEKDIRAIEEAGPPTTYSRADFLHGFAKVFATKNKLRSSGFPTPQMGAPGPTVGDTVKNVFRDQKIGKYLEGKNLDSIDKRSRHKRVEEMKKRFGIKRSQVYIHWNCWKALSREIGECLDATGKPLRRERVKQLMEQFVMTRHQVFDHWRRWDRLQKPKPKCTKIQRIPSSTSLDE